MLLTTSGGRNNNMMEVGSILWKLSYMIHVISNAIFFGILFSFSFGSSEILKENIFKSFMKLSFILVLLVGTTGILLLSIYTIHGLMNDLTSNPVGQSILVMLLGYTIVLFIISLALIYKGGEARIFRNLSRIMFFIYLFVYMARTYLTS